VSLDALIIADSGTDSVSGSSPMRLTIEGRDATIQVVRNYLEHHGKMVSPLAGDDHSIWSAAPRLNGIALLSDLQQHGYTAALINDFSRESARFDCFLKSPPKAIVVSTTFIIGKAPLRDLIATIRKCAPGIPIIVGGPFVFTSHRIYLRRHEAEFCTPELQKDFLFQGDNEPDIDLYVTDLHGQKTLRGALDRVRAGAPLEGLPHTAWRNQDGCYQFGSPDGPDLQRLAEERIDWDALPEELFASKVVPLQASSGCPFQCAFCNFVKDHHNTYAKSIDRIIEEMTAVARRGVRYVWFVDDIFRLGHGDLAATCKAMIAAGLDLKWMTFIRADTVKNIDFDLLKKAGCVELQFGLESADPGVLAAMNKKANPEVYRSTVKQALAAGINVSAYFLFGHPGETMESIARTIAFMQEIQFPNLPGSLTWSIYPFLLIPLSPIFEPEQRRQYDLQGYMMNWRHATMDSRTAMQAIRQAIMALQDSAPICRTDNLAMLEELDPGTRKAFFRARLHLAKLAAAGKADPETVYSTFADVLKVS
jgi:anaerobic magnesium-protoporphyrin IX monomethyl ester cyclase